MIEIERLTKKFGHFIAVNNLSFSVAPGEVLGFLGPNGAGKSTTMKMITGFLKPTSGKVSLLGHDMAQNGHLVKMDIGYLPEGAPLYSDMLVINFLKFITEVRQIPPNKAKAAIERVVALLGLENVLMKPVETLSKGFNRRVGLAQAIIHDPKILILDEPTDGLDPNQKFQVRQLITSLAKDKIIIISTHILEEVAAVCTRASILSGGELKFNGTPQELEAKSKYQGAVSLKLSSAVVKEDLLRLTSVQEVETLDESGHELILFPKQGISPERLPADIQSYLQEKGILAKSFVVEAGRLDEVFRDITLQGRGQEKNNQENKLFQSPAA